MLGLISSFIKLKTYIFSKASLKPIFFTRERRTEEWDLKDITSSPSASSFENSKLAQPVIARRFFTWTPADIFTQFCRAKLQRTVNRLYCLYPIYPSAARSFPPLRTLLPWARPKDLRPLESRIIRIF